MGDNGKDDKEKRFRENPDDFVEIKDLILAAQKTDKGVAVLINRPGIVTRNDILLAKAELNHLAEQRLNALDLQKHMKDHPIIKPKGRILGLSRGKH